MEVLNKQKVVIFGKSYLISTNENVDEVALSVETVNSLMKEISGKMATKDPYNVAILTALQLASDLVKSRKCLDLRQTELDQLLNSLDSLIKEL